MLLCALAVLLCGAAAPPAMDATKMALKWH
ncbi:hypothetical protein ENH_00056900 [Eimeria necatrix]|uniref:SAG family member n=1 Tax=Eimeria necatrix TaxID=51315 RepID=U6N1S1_9EIME|nr:hypothetical protein ENH_00056900 [Eimeria necatrix]CDJ68694.1 hypothetical protein ENH_00056900 [Eimeria necatrix]